MWIKGPLETRLSPTPAKTSPRCRHCHPHPNNNLFRNGKLSGPPNNPGGKLEVPCSTVGSNMGPAPSSSSFPLSMGMKQGHVLYGGLKLSGFSLSDVPLEEQNMDGNHLLVKCLLSNGEDLIETPALVDCGASGFAFIDEEFVRQHHLPRISYACLAPSR